MAYARTIERGDAVLITYNVPGVALTLRGKALDRPGNYYAPTVLTNIPKDSPGYKEELFGPVACVFRVKDIDEAIHVANDCRFGLGSSAWTNDPQERERFVNEIDAGMVFINKMVASDPRMPFGGVANPSVARRPR